MQVVPAAVSARMLAVATQVPRERDQLRTPRQYKRVNCDVYVLLCQSYRGQLPFPGEASWRKLLRVASVQILRQRRLTHMTLLQVTHEPAKLHTVKPDNQPGTCRISC